MPSGEREGLDDDKVTLGAWPLAVKDMEVKIEDETMVLGGT